MSGARHQGDDGVDLARLSLGSARERLAAWAPEGASRAEMRAYARYSAGRILASAKRLASLPRGARVLEIGANPYFLTVLMRVARPDLEWVCTNFDASVSEAGPFGAVVQHAESGELVELSWYQANVETERLPFDDSAFDAVVYCEVLEHLHKDPAASFTAVHRVLKSGGSLLLTTPNPAAASNVWRLLRKQSIDDPISAHGPYGRHHREYSSRELSELLERSGFTTRSAVTVETSNGSPVRRGLAKVGYGAHHVVLAVRDAGPTPAEPHRPGWLYRSFGRVETEGS